MSCGVRMPDVPHILIVDDHEDSRALAAAVLRRHFPGCRTSVAEDGPSGLAAALGLRPDLVVLDADLPGLHGFDVCRQLKQKTQPVMTPVLIVTGVQVESGSRTIGIESGADGYLTKPYDVREFVALVRSLLRLKQNEDALRTAQETLEKALDERTRELRQLEQRNRRIIETLVEGLAVVRDGRVVFSNPAFLDICGIEAISGERDGEEMVRLIHPDDRSRVRAAWRAAIEGCSVPRQVFRVVRPDGGVRWIDMSVCLTEYEGRAALEVCGLDVTDRRLSDLAIHRFSHRLLSAREDERHRLSSMLHHECGSFALALNAHLVAAADEMRAGDARAAVAETARTGKLLDGFVGRLRRLAIDLRPPDLDVLGYSAAMANHVATLRGSARVSIRIEHAVPDDDISAELAIVLFRVTQEALNNAIRHAQASEIVVSLQPGDQNVELAIIDNGRGFDVGGVSRSPEGGIGLRAMAEMVEAWGGIFAVESEPSKGATVRAYLPRARGTVAPMLDYEILMGHVV